jgi:pimeloyl-ACP methyl ester carboxylesterase
MNRLAVYGNTTLQKGIRSRFLDGINGLRMHILEAGYQYKKRSLVMLLHGFPELAYSWRKQLIPLAEAGYHVVAPDQRGYGRTTGWDGNYDGDVGSFRMFNLVKDILALVFALGYKNVASVIGHDFGSPVAAYCALTRPDVFKTVILMSAPFGGAPALPFKTVAKKKPGTQSESASSNIHQDLANLPRPRKHYQWYYSSRDANEDMHHCPQGVHNFLRAYYHFKSADWKANQPFPLKTWSAFELSKLPTYYVMDYHKGMAETAAEAMPTPDEVAECNWLTEEELKVYSTEYIRNGFQGGLQWYRCATDPNFSEDLQIFSGRTIDVPAWFIAGASDWGSYQAPGRLEEMRSKACTKMRPPCFIQGAGHWVQQEQPDLVSQHLLKFIRENP